ncbi:conserved hypothetical protein [Aspergillus terreus NIH2624]|uniref:Uncharacterized protein n=1 Tax=Aspergillus terreus (strain NIH 2624 / FGSC A1156) TaxID=341663 RepID=Q0CZ18_ASPTN|nr:uncharacterized protein ATEG_01066 [Aspergillus terreus NIH2624]EAU37823.1 conserved hypothetical protein [Aspergillus terreus NIH2624]
MSHEKSASRSGSSSQLPPELSDVQCFTDTKGVITTTMFDVPGYRVTKVFGTVYGITVRSRNWAAGLGMVLKSIAGGELRWFTNMVCLPPLDSGLGLGLRVDAWAGLMWVCAYGTACLVEKVEQDEELPLYPQLFPH